MKSLSRQLALTVTGLVAQQSALRFPELRSPLCSNVHLHPTVWMTLMQSQRSAQDHAALCGRPLDPEQIAYVIAHEKRVGPLAALAAHNTLPTEVYRAFLNTRVAASIAESGLACGKIPAELIDAYMPLALSPRSLEVVEHPVGDTITAEKLFVFASRFRIDTHSTAVFTALVERRPDLIPCIVQSARLSWWTVLSRTRHIAGLLPVLKAAIERVDTERNLAHLSSIAHALRANPWISADEYRAVLASRCFAGLHMQGLVQHQLGNDWVAPSCPLDEMTDPGQLADVARFIIASRRYWEYGSLLQRPVPMIVVEQIRAEVERNRGGRVSARTAHTMARLSELGSPVKPLQRVAFPGDKSTDLADIHASALARFVPDDAASWELVFGLVDGFSGDTGQFLTNVEALRV